jgi:hypothetical protein
MRRGKEHWIVWVDAASQYMQRLQVRRPIAPLACQLLMLHSMEHQCVGTAAHMLCGVAKDLTKLGGKTVTKLVIPDEKGQGTLDRVGGCCQPVHATPASAQTHSTSGLSAADAA